MFKVNESFYLKYLISFDIRDASSHLDFIVLEVVIVDFL